MNLKNIYQQQSRKSLCHTSKTWPLRSWLKKNGTKMVFLYWNLYATPFWKEKSRILALRRVAADEDVMARPMKTGGSSMRLFEDINFPNWEAMVCWIEKELNSFASNNFSTFYLWLLTSGSLIIPSSYLVRTDKKSVWVFCWKVAVMKFLGIWMWCLSASGILHLSRSLLMAWDKA